MTKTLTRQTAQVCVLDQNGKPLMPTTRLGKVYRLLKIQKAHIVSYEPFTIQLNYEPDTHIIQPMTLGVDSGAIHSGYSVANEHREYYSAEVIARDDISKRLSDRQMYRRNRRSRKTRYRKPRFNNRKNKKKGWLPPSLKQKVAVQLNEIDHFGFQLYDLVLFNNHYYYIKGRRSSGYFKLTSIEGLKDEERTYKKLTLLTHTNAYLTNRYLNT